jgi:crotonobetainyl-CoA:carnitine CoA-transferase CaiB-like acyl-CoA transferase
VLGVANERQWETLCDLLGATALKTDPRFINNGMRVANREALVQELNQIFSRRSVDEWLTDIAKAGLPCGPINSIPQVFAHPQTQARQMTLETSHPTAGTVKLTGFPYKFSETPAEIHAPPPTLGQHTEETLSTLLGYSPAEIEALKASKAI